MNDVTIYIKGNSIEIDSPEPLKLVVGGVRQSNIKQLGKGAIHIELMEDVVITMVDDEVDWVIL